MAASEAIRFHELAQLPPFSHTRVSLFLTFTPFTLRRFVPFLVIDRAIVGLLFSAARVAKS
jgi:hypothetical protein